jgi:hypothetical protein
LTPPAKGDQPVDVGYKVYPPNVEEIGRRFTYRAPKPDQVPKYEELRDLAKAMAMRLETLCPPSRELSLSLTHLDEVVMFANAAIARRE